MLRWGSFMTRLVFNRASTVLLLSLFAFLSIPLSASAAAIVVSVSGRKLLVTGQPFTIQGVNYSPTPVGETLGNPANGCLGPYQWWTDRATYVADFPLIAKMGANTIRTFDVMNSGSTSAQVLQALDAAQANHLHVVMGYFVQTFFNLSDPAIQTQLRNEFKASVLAYKDHPAVLMWAIGNEQNLNNGNSNAAWYTLLNQMAGDAKAIDSNHPVTSVQGEIPGATDYQIGSAALGTDDPTMTNLDLWSVTSYRGMSFGNLFSVMASSTTKPVFIAEFGKDAYRDSTAQEDQSMQASYINSQWQEIAANASASAAGKVIVGGTVFEWTDEWWKDLGGVSCFSHDTAVLFVRPADTVDPNYQDEWFGMASVSPVDAVSNPAGTARGLRKAYTTLQSFWNPSAATAAGASNSLFEGTVRNYPNPFRVGSENTKFVALTTQAASVTLGIYDAGGQFVTSITRASNGPGRMEIVWDGRNSRGEQVSAGLYIVRIEGKGGSLEEKQFRRVVAVK
jgi:hypothetical protein